MGTNVQKGWELKRKGPSVTFPIIFTYMNLTFIARFSHPHQQTFNSTDSPLTLMLLPLYFRKNVKGDRYLYRKRNKRIKGRKSQLIHIFQNRF